MIDPDTWLAAVRADPAEALVLADLLADEYGDEGRARRLRRRYFRYWDARMRAVLGYDEYEHGGPIDWRSTRMVYADRPSVAHQDTLFVRYVAKLLKEVADG